jgi:hypothetical protein
MHRMGKNPKQYPVHPCSFLNPALPELDSGGDARMVGGGKRGGTGRLLLSAVRRTGGQMECDAAGAMRQYATRRNRFALFICKAPHGREETRGSGDTGSVLSPRPPFDRAQGTPGLFPQNATVHAAQSPGRRRIVDSRAAGRVLMRLIVRLWVRLQRGSRTGRAIGLNRKAFRSNGLGIYYMGCHATVAAL